MGPTEEIVDRGGTAEPHRQTLDGDILGSEKPLPLKKIDRGTIVRRTHRPSLNS